MHLYIILLHLTITFKQNYGCKIFSNSSSTTPKWLNMTIFTMLMWLSHAAFIKSIPNCFVSLMIWHTDAVLLVNQTSNFCIQFNQDYVCLNFTLKKTILIFNQFHELVQNDDGQLEIIIESRDWDGEAMVLSPIQQKNGTLTIQIAIFNLGRMAHWNWNIIGKDGKWSKPLGLPFPITVKVMINFIKSYNNINNSNITFYTVHKLVNWLFA